MHKPGCNITTARSRWAKPSEWVLALAEACDSSSQSKVADKLGYSPTVINQVLRNCYPGDLASVKGKVEGVYMGRVVECPALGEISLAVCLTYQKQDYANTNHQRIMMYQACRSGCANNRQIFVEGGVPGNGRQNKNHNFTE